MLFKDKKSKDQKYFEVRNNDFVATNYHSEYGGQSGNNLGQFFKKASYL